MTDYKDTLNLPATDFPMRADLPTREPQLIDFWQKNQIYQQQRALRAGQPKYILHDGPPYANGHLHIGHALNKTLKDIVVKSKNLSGFDAPFVPGWDCHGLPIELNVEKEIGKAGDKVSAAEFRKKCRDYAKSQMQIQSEEFQRLGVHGDFLNPYATMDFQYEANIIRAVAEVVANGYLQRGYKPVYWCTACQSALAEAEVEYQDKMSPAIDVAFNAIAPQRFFEIFKVKLTDKEIVVPIWTTTPWTLPANEAVTLNPGLEYVLIKTPEKYYVLALDLHQVVMARYGVKDFKIIAAVKGEALENLLLQHPFLAKTAKIVLGDHVTVDAGTGNVHTAPAHGQDDYVVCTRYGIEVKNPVGSNGCFVENTPFFAGLHVFKANQPVIEKLRENHKLIHLEEISHAYPHCWRHKTPLIFRATAQWFIAMDQVHLRSQALSAVDHIEWDPDWGHARMSNMLVSRPDWCISRQRAWGTPLPLFIHKTTAELHPKTVELINAVADQVEQQGIEAWYELDAKALLGAEAQNYEKITDVLDVWFDSGVSHYCVLMQRQDLAWPANLYLEGSDQYRGWFQSSLLTGLMLKSQSPFDYILTHGFTVDTKGRKMSKSIGNVIAPEKIWQTLGADILRLWIASTDYRNEVTVSDEIFKRTADSYRRIRNTARFLLSNLFDFNPVKNLVTADKLLALDAYAIHLTMASQAEIIKAYDDFQFHHVSKKIHYFCAQEMGSFYLDVIKDRLYTMPKDSLGRRSAQTAMYYILQSLVRWLAPILSFTAEEIYQHLPFEKQASVFLTTWFEQLPEMRQNKIDWELIIKIRDEVNKALETARNANQIGSALEASVKLYVDADLKNILEPLSDELRFIFITSEASVLSAIDKTESALQTDVAGLWLEIEALDLAKCVRCWHRRADIGEYADHPELCQRCVENIESDGEKRRFA